MLLAPHAPEGRGAAALGRPEQNTFILPTDSPVVLGEHRLVVTTMHKQRQLANCTLRRSVADQHTKRLLFRGPTCADALKIAEQLIVRAALVGYQLAAPAILVKELCRAVEALKEQLPKWQCDHAQAVLRRSVHAEETDHVLLGVVAVILRKYVAHVLADASNIIDACKRTKAKLGKDEEAIGPLQDLQADMQACQSILLHAEQSVAQIASDVTKQVRAFHHSPSLILKPCVPSTSPALTLQRALALAPRAALASAKRRVRRVRRELRRVR